MWDLLKTKKLEGYKFRRQHIIDRFITDFVCLKQKLVIELDGLIHQLPENLLSDQQRTDRLSELGFSVIRFTNEQVLNNTEQTVQKILSALKILQAANQTETNPAKKSTISDLSAPTGGQGAFPTGGQGASPIVIADLSKLESITQKALQAVGYTYNSISDKWSIADGAADFIFTGHTILDFALPGTLKVIVYPATWLQVQTGTSAIENIATESYVPIFDVEGYLASEIKGAINFVMFDCEQYEGTLKNLEHLDKFGADPSVVLCLSSRDARPVDSLRLTFEALQERNITNRTVLVVDSDWHTADEHLVHYAIEAGALLLEGLGNGICLGMTAEAYQQQAERFATPAGRGFLQSTSVEQFLNNTAFSILQATRRRISKTEYISCPSCGRTLFDLQETTAKIRAVTNHLKGVKIAIMGCIVNGPGEMADADFGYVGSGPGKITLYKGKEVVKRNVPSEIAVQELIQLLKDCHAWIEPQDVFDTTIKEEALEKT
jgi:(E)-4-hydroxy-3-methylbut-2-enyl-diphosphate synthase